MDNFLHIFADGGSRGNPGQAAIGVVIKTENATVVKRISEKLGLATNNEAEYQALIKALEYLSQNKEKLNITRETNLNFYLDSKLIVNQVNGFYKVKNSNLRIFLLKVRELENYLPGKITYNLISRENNRQADQLVNLALDS